MPILADESVNYKIVKELRNNGFEVISILEKHPSISDKAVLENISNSLTVILLFLG
jgi:hypothetical protein